jgi:diguanylate cyclase (GGDEF)-like protein
MPHVLELPRLTAALLAVAFAAAVAAGAWFVGLAGQDQRIPSIVVALGVMLCLAILISIFVFTSRQVARLEQLALTDSLCGLLNRRALHRDVKRGSDIGSDVAIALIDLDGFKTVNDFYGHSVGDQTIKQFSALLVNICAENGTAYRLGGDEFALVVTGPLAGTILEGICRRLIAQLDLPVTVADRSIALGASIGLAQGIKTAEAAAISTDLLRKADVAMYAAKSRGKMRVTWFNDDFDKNREMHQVIDADLRKALTNGELRMHYQPVIDSRTGQVNSVEALIRWERPDGQRIGPDKFIPVAEESGLIEVIGLWVLRQACNDALDWDDIKLSVNASVAQLRNPQFPLQLGQILEETGFPPTRLELEITETFLMGDPTVARRNLEMIREFGVAIVLDDYGTGYASIGFLRRFRFEKLKLDRSLIADSASDDATRTIMTSSVAMAKALGMSVTAEGIETEHHAALARTAGCDQMQGWLYFKAIPANEIAQHLDTPDSAKAAIGRTIRAIKA